MKRNASGAKKGAKRIDGVEVKELKIIPDERGMLAEILRCDDKIFKKFGQVYFTTAYPGIVKAWHYHKLQTDHLCCISGTGKLAIYDPRKNSKTKGMVNEFFMGPRNLILVSIPPNVMHGFKAIGPEEAIFINIPTEVYRADAPDEFRVPWDDPSIPYDWAAKNG